MLLFIVSIDAFLFTRSHDPYRNFQDQLLAIVIRFEGVENGRELFAVEFH